MARPSDEPTFSQRYRSIYERGSKIPQQTDWREVAFFSSLLPSERRMRVLDLGCGEGELAVLLARKGHSVVASDISAGNLSQAREKARIACVEIETVECDIEDGESAFASRQFDAVFFMNVLEHLRSPIVGLERTRRLLAKEGRLYIHTPNSCSFSRFLSAILFEPRIVGCFRADSIEDLHLQGYDWRLLQQLCNFSGLRVERIIPTCLTIIGRVRSRALARAFPAISDSLLFECRKCQPLDLDEVMDFMFKKTEKGIVPAPKPPS